MKTAITISIAIALSMAAMVSGSAQPAPTAPPPVIPVSSPLVGPWIVGGIGLGVLSLMARPAVIGAREDRELTSPEATQAFFLPFFWMVGPVVLLPHEDAKLLTEGHKFDLGEHFPAGQPDPGRVSSSNDWSSPKGPEGKPTLRIKRHRKAKPNLG
jgi:hypothetical protein